MVIKTSGFKGAGYNPVLDRRRLTGQLLAIYRSMQDGHWRTLRDIELLTGAPTSSISAQLRNLRKPEFGGYKVEKRRVAKSGIWQYRVTAPVETDQKGQMVMFGCSAIAN